AMAYSPTASHSRMRSRLLPTVLFLLSRTICNIDQSCGSANPAPAARLGTDRRPACRVVPGAPRVAKPFLIYRVFVSDPPDDCAFDCANVHPPARRPRLTSPVQARSRPANMAGGQITSTAVKDAAQIQPWPAGGAGRRPGMEASIGKKVSGCLASR